MTLPVVHNLTVYRGDSWSQTFRFLVGSTPVDLTSATVASEARARDGTRTPLEVTVDDATDGRIVLALPVGSLPVASYDYDVEVDQDGDVTTWVRGSLSVTRDVTNEIGVG